MIAQRTRLEVIAANLANKDTMFDAQGKLNPYRRKEVFFAPGDPGASTEEGRALGVHVADIQDDPSGLMVKYDPSSPYADKEGRVFLPNVHPVTEQVNAIEASRAYEANVVAAEATKSMMAQALRLLA
ncbi:MAG: flagellar basal body rod protein FlgC [Phycisphaerales bacterium]|nr:flagellar basal body rod protein FlgC [Phycisphaerales bacterium]